VTWAAEAAIRWSARLAVRRIDLQTEGLENLPRQGPVLLAARHYHHFWDGCALLAAVPRPMHVVVTLDWMTSPFGRSVMARLCHAVDWPVVERTALPAGERHGASGWERSGANGAIRQRVPLRAALELLRRSRVLLIFPEAYPTVDPHGTPKTHDDEFLPFRPGVLRLAALSERETGVPVPIVPVGLEYQHGPRWSLRMRFGEPRWFEHGRDRVVQRQELEADVRRLSGLQTAAALPEGFALANGPWRGGAS
jgi:1-acyl-sn-glycerol-3-phosphate acyltransferase